MDYFVLVHRHHPYVLDLNLANVLSMCREFLVWLGVKNKLSELCDYPE